MKKIFQYVKKLFSANTKTTHTKETLAIDAQYPKTKTENNAYLTMPKAFDFIAYFNDKELENSTEDMSHKNLTTDTNNEVLSMKEEKCNEMLYS